MQSRDCKNRVFLHTNAGTIAKIVGTLYYITVLFFNLIWNYILKAFLIQNLETLYNTVGQEKHPGKHSPANPGMNKRIF